MTPTLDISSETVRQIADTATRRGQTPETYLRSLLEKDTAAEGGNWEMLDQEVQRLTSRTAEEVQAARERILKASPSPRKLPPGMTLLDMVEGKWPGDETDAEIRAALERNS